ncbi:MAG: tRNA (guanosine(46)-N7)-methyltransferase TrmB [Deltaproteobacteria bacterium]|nr:tRNA (guanosine(46)-N7)-methyltransferase TrmB [Deltaproteobacteria bacterium]
MTSPDSAHTCAHPDELRPDWPRDFLRTGAQRLELEIGPGRGAFALDHAKAHPELDLVAIETRRSDVEEIRERAHKRGIRNLMVFHGDAKVLVPRWFGPGQLSQVHVQFPDPWWKARHHKRRMVDVELAALLRLLLHKDGEVDFRTDVPEYAKSAVRTWEDAGFVNVDGAGGLSKLIPETLSTRERRYAQTGQPVYRARFINPGPPDVNVDVLAERLEEQGRTGREWKDVRRK